MSKIKTMTLTFPHPNMDRDFVPNGPFDPDHYVYRVAKVTDSVEYVPGKTLLKKEVDALCESKAWKVIVTETK
jgi:hypothetical protein